MDTTTSSNTYVTKNSTMTFAATAGFMMVAMAAVALMFPGIMTNLKPLLVEYSHGWFMGVVPMNLTNKMLLILMGFTGILMSTTRTKAVLYSKIVFWLNAPLAVMGLFEATNTMFGLAPLYATQVAIYGLFALMGLFFGYKSNR
jgi:hypothetical protein